MRTRLLRWLALLVIVFGQPGCGGGHVELPIGFVNRTANSTDAYLAELWFRAQRQVSLQIDLNPIGRQHGEPPHYLPGDSRAFAIPPRQIIVQAIPDVSAYDLFVATGIVRSDPTGFILCPAPCNVTYDSSYTQFPTRLVAYAASWEFTSDPNIFAQIVEYEFESQILYRLGYDVSAR